MTDAEMWRQITAAENRGIRVGLELGRGELRETAESLAKALEDMMLSVEVFHGREGWDLYQDGAPEWKRALSALAAWRAKAEGRETP